MHDFATGSSYASMYLKLINILEYISGVLVLLAIVVFIYIICWIYVEKKFLNPLAEQVIKCAKRPTNEDIK